VKIDALAEPSRPAANRPQARSRTLRILFATPWWFIVLIFVGIYVASLVRNDPIYAGIFVQLQGGIALTLTVSFVAYLSALVIGLIIGLIRANPPTIGYGGLGVVVGIIRLFLYNVATLYVQVLRGLPILVTLLIVAFVIVPEVNRFSRTVLGIDLGIRGTSPTSAIFALAITYGAFLSETIRAGIQSVGRGQIEAARSLGMNYVQVTRYIVLPQAMRRVLPPLGNDMIAMIKDSSLVAILGVQDITQLAKLSSSSSFRYLETYLLAATIYLTMTILGSLLVRQIEKRFPVER
jgi:ABC-type amino acid transport system permease subunit